MGSTVQFELKLGTRQNFKGENSEKVAFVISQNFWFSRNMILSLHYYIHLFYIYM